MRGEEAGWHPLGGYRYLRPLLFRLPPEWMHHASLAALKWVGERHLGRRFIQHAYSPLTRGEIRDETPDMPLELPRLGLTFRNTLGLAAGYDKNALALEGLAALGFGHLEIGTVTLRPQAGNSGLRVRRLPSQSALVNRMGFPSAGAEIVAKRLERYRARASRRADLSGSHPPIIGVNIGKNRDTPNERAADDYVELTRRLAPLADYLTVNISSPNTPGLRDLQRLDALKRLLHPLLEARESLSSARGVRPPLLVKLAPEVLTAQPSHLEADVDSTSSFDLLIECLHDLGVEGVILANTRRVAEPLAGGLSGAPLFEDTLALTQRAKQIAPQLCVIASGGVGTHQQRLELERCGADLVQVWTALIYRGPLLIRCLSGSSPESLR